jgi:hypothetical protein
MRQKKIKIPLYFGTLTLIQTEDFKAIEKKYNLTTTECCDAITFEVGEEVIVLFGAETSASLMAHEAVHVTSIVFTNVGIKGDLDNDEPFAYFLGWVVEQMDKFLAAKKN